MSAPETWIGRSLNRREDDRLLRGEGMFVDDIGDTDVLHVAFLRSPMATSVIAKLAIERAEARPGVVAVFTGVDVAHLGDLPVNKILENTITPPYPILTTGRIQAVGQPLAAIVATTRAAADEAMEQIDLELDEAVFADTDLAFQQNWPADGIEQTMQGAHKILAVEIEHARLAPCPLEPRAVLADWQDSQEKLTVWLSSQTPHRARSDLAHILSLAEGRVRVISPDVGGAFGMKASLYPEEVMVAFAAIKLRHRVKWCATRSEEFLSASHGRGLKTRGQLAVNREGTFLALAAEIEAPLGHWMTYSAAVPAWNAARILPGPYMIDTVDIKTAGRLSDTAAVGIYRGAGRPEAAMLMERLVDEAAGALALDPFEIRARNLLSPEDLPHLSGTGALLDSGDYPALLARLKQQADYPALRQEQKARRAVGELVGIGLAFFVEPCGQGWESARVSVSETGKITVATGSSSQGQARETAYAQIAADVFAIPACQIDVIHGDTDTAPAGIGALASRSTAIGGSAVLEAAEKLKLAIQDTFGANLFDPFSLAAAMAGETLSTELVYHSAGEAWSYGAYLAVVSIDRDTGVPNIEQIFAVDDAGLVVNPMLVESQITGAIAQGLGEALMEQLIYDSDGQLLTGTLMDYALPHADDMPAIDLSMMKTTTTSNLLGAKGVGEAGTIGAPPAVINAALDALTPFGVRDLTMPLRAENIWRAMKKAEQERDDENEI